MQRLRGSDAYTIYAGTPRSPFFTLKVAIYQPADEFSLPESEEIRAFVKQGITGAGDSRAALRIVRVPLDLHHPVWVRAAGFNPDQHIKETTLPAPGGKTELSNFLSELMGAPMDADQPPWEVWVINGLADSRLAIAFKVHHALADGKTMARLIEYAHSPRPFPRATEVEAFTQEEPLPGKLALIGHALIDLVKSYTIDLPHFYRYIKQARASKKIASNDEPDTGAAKLPPFTLLNADHNSPERIYLYETFSLADIKALAHQFDCTINTLLLGIFSEALRRYLRDVDTEPTDSLVTAIAVGEQKGEGFRLHKKPEIHNNNLSVAYVPLYQTIADFRERLQAIKAASKKAVDEVRSGDGPRFDNYLDFLPGTAIRILNRILKYRQRKHLNPVANVVISNVPGPRRALTALDGRLQMQELLSVGNLIDAANLNITIWSYADRMSFSFLFRKDALPQHELLVSHTRQVVTELAPEQAQRQPGNR